ncbi:bifunctional helix-turn-helix transcriptional regulator/GNAT family N-acetyltransferase [Sciscionella marina]|uniref:bifunctional helix-turn-helix transcriptional regulator/GNAT family N-acetyltransferase n=1 Tax=Sciscionella marina TaxID=508770 RepID=UPI000366A6A1|nr:helix-turn-helix domain-containing GNAT family N-acetyltransferase [Sciscionella marina]
MKSTTKSQQSQDSHAIGEVRAFNRFYTNHIGLLDYRAMGLGYSLAESRVLYEIAETPGIDTTELRTRLGLDPGYLSRILRGFATDGLAVKEPAADARKHLVTLTERGRSAQAEQDRASSAHIGEHLADLTGAERDRLLDALRTVREVLGERPRSRTMVLRAPRPGELGQVIARNGARYAEEYGWDASYETLVAGIIADFAARGDTEREAAWIAELDGEAVGAVFCMRADAETARLRCLLVEPRARGLGVGSRLVRECVEFARRTGYRRVVLWTTHVLTDARRIYERAGFRLAEETAHPGFGTGELRGQTFELDISSPGTGSANQ